MTRCMHINGMNLQQQALVYMHMLRQNIPDLDNSELMISA